MRVRVGMPPRVILEFDRESISGHLKAHQLPDDCLSWLHHEIPYMLTAILGGKRTITARYLSHTVARDSEEEPSASEEQIRNEFTARMEYVEDKLVTESLRHQYSIKQTSKTNVYSDMTWEVVQKQAESTGGAPPNLTYATVRITAHKPSPDGNELPVFVQLPFSLGLQSDDDALTISMALEDIRDLKAKLDEAAEALSNATQNGSEA